VHAGTTDRFTDDSNVALPKLDLDSIRSFDLEIDVVIVHEVSPLPSTNRSHQSDGQRVERQRARGHKERERLAVSVHAVFRSSYANGRLTLGHFVRKQDAYIT
jgi:hypothetical protein